MAGARAVPDVDLGPKKDADLPVDDPGYQPAFYRGETVKKAKPPVVRKRSSAMAEAMRRRIDAGKGET